MLEPVGRLFLWRYAIHLVHKTVKPSWEGPLFSAGYRDFVIESTFYNRFGEGYSPDIAIVGKDDWLVLELTTDSKSKATQVNHYRTLAPEYLFTDQSLPVPSGRRPPIPIVVRPQTGVPDGCTQIVVGDPVSVSGADEIPDETLRKALRRIDGTRLGPIPQVRLAFVPECNQREIRRGLIPSIKSLLSVPGRSATVHSLVEEGLDFLWPRVSARGRTLLMGKVHEAMDNLVTKEGGPLSDYLVLGDDGYTSSGQEPLHHMSLEKVEELLGEWVRKSPPGRRAELSEFDSAPES